MGIYEKYRDEFKKEAVRLLVSTGKPKTTIEKNRHHKWLVRSMVGTFQDQRRNGCIGIERYGAAKVEVRRLKRKAEILRQEATS